MPTPTEIKAKALAKELVDAFTFRKVDGTIVRYDRTIQCALISCNKTIETLNNIKGLSKMGQLKLWKLTKQYVQEM